MGISFHEHHIPWNQNDFLRKAQTDQNCSEEYKRLDCISQKDRRNGGFLYLKKNANELGMVEHHFRFYALG